MSEASSRYQQRLERFTSDLRQRLESDRKARARVDRYLSTAFNVFDRIKPDENRLSDIIADLLDPAGSHGQQRVFLDAFLRTCSVDERSCKAQPNVSRESSTDYIERSRRRVDIEVEFERFIEGQLERFGLGIENKPWAGDQEKQLEEYCGYLNKKYNGAFCIAYISPHGRRPTSMQDQLIEERIHKGQLRQLSYRHDIAQWLLECRQLCESDKFRWFLRDFRDYILNEFPLSPTETKDGDFD